MSNTLSAYHVPVLLKATVDGLLVRNGGVYVDVTFGGGGHSREILARMGKESQLFSFDQDADAEKNATIKDPRFTFVRSNFRYLKNWMRYYGITHIDGLLADLGVSSHHFDDPSRGFSFRFGGNLDMRMNSRAGMTAAEVLNTYDEDRLAKIFTLYGELRNGRRLAHEVIKRRAENSIETVEDFISIAHPFINGAREKKDMAKVFQALRIEVNHELDALQEMLAAAIELLHKGGRLCVLTYHSLEDRIVKNFIRSGNAEGKVEEDFFGNRLAPLRAVNNKVIVADDEEQNSNPRSRSAKLRIAEKI